jgi:hypothetical protein
VGEGNLAMHSICAASSNNPTPTLPYFAGEGAKHDGEMLRPSYCPNNSCTINPVAIATSTYSPSSLRYQP